VSVDRYLAEKHLGSPKYGVADAEGLGASPPPSCHLSCTAGIVPLQDVVECVRAILSLTSLGQPALAVAAFEALLPLLTAPRPATQGPAGSDSSSGDSDDDDEEEEEEDGERTEVDAAGVGYRFAFAPEDHASLLMVLPPRARLLSHRSLACFSARFTRFSPFGQSACPLLALLKLPPCADALA